MFYSNKIIIGMLTIAVSGMVATTILADNTTGFSGTLVNPKAKQPGWQLPDSAINTTTIPEIILDINDKPTEPLPVYRLSPSTYMFYGNIATLDKKNRGWNANAGFIVTSQGVIVIDTLGTPYLGQRMIATIRTITKQPVRYVIVTHNHPDHAYGYAAFDKLPDVNIIAHPGTVEYNHSATLESSVEYRRELLPDDMQDFMPLQAKSYLKVSPFKYKRIQIGDEIIDIYNTGKHHSYGDLLVYQPHQKILWVSDLVFNQRTTYMGDGSSSQILKAQDWLAKEFKDVELMVPGHGSAQTKPFPMLKRTHDYVTRMRKAMQKAVNKGVPLFDAVQNTDFEDWRDSRLYESNQRANANFVYREMEREYFNNF